MSSRNVRAVEPQDVDDESQIMKPDVTMMARAEVVLRQTRIIRFKGRPMVLVSEPYPHYIPLTESYFKDIVYQYGPIPRTKIGDLYDYVSHTVEDLTTNDRYILFGIPDDQDKHPNSIVSVWDAENLEMLTLEIVPAEQCIWRSPYGKISQKQMFSDTPDYPERIPFIMQLAQNDEGLYDDIMLSMAPIVMKQKPDGVIWWVGGGANGKSTLMDALYEMFPGQLVGLTVKQITDGTDLKMLNGRLANIVRESSEGRIDDTQHYKSLGTHENFPVHEFHKQEGMTIEANLHHIFSANEIPVFNDKGLSARRRTFIIPFNATFESNPEFKKETFTPELFGRLAAELCRYAIRLKRAHYRYPFSAATTGAKKRYDSQVNSAENYIKHIVNEGVVAFETFKPLKWAYEDWCAEMGYVPLGVRALQKTAQDYGFEHQSYRPSPDQKPSHHWRLKSADPMLLQPFSPKYNELYTMPGFKKEEPDEPIIPEFHEPKRETVPPDDDDEDDYTPPVTRLRGEW